MCTWARQYTQSWTSKDEYPAHRNKQLCDVHKVFPTGRHWPNGHLREECACCALSDGTGGQAACATVGEDRSLAY